MIKKIFIVIVSIIFLLAAFAYSIGVVICYGPSEQARDIFTISMLETSALKFVPSIYLSKNEIQNIVNGNTVQEEGKITDTDLIEVKEEKNKNIDIIEIKGDTFKGKLMIIHDPSRIYVATPSELGKDKAGLRVEDMVKRDKAIAGVNGGGFADEGGIGLGGQPLGIVISNGKYLSGEKNTEYNIIGIDNDNKLIVGKMTPNQAIDAGIRDALSFGPNLIINGEPVKIAGTGGGLNPRTAIGQRSDGAILLLVIDGRQTHSLGATYKDIQNIMIEHEAVNAANMDGGSSSVMIYKDKTINICASLYGSRRLPTAVLVRGVENE